MPGLEQVRDSNSAAGLSRSRANTALYARANDDSDIIVNNQIGPSAVRRSYGTLPLRPRKLTNQSMALNFGRTLSQWGLQRVRSNSSAILRSSPSSIFSVGRLSRPISTYDDPRVKSHAEADADAKVNGIRVWYSSFTSIDWLHDTIKDSLRFSMLRRRKSLRGRLWLTFDKSLGWIIVTIVGFLTAVVAFLIVRTEQLLFDAKEGYCTSSWWKAKRFCCPHFDDEELTVTRGDRLFKEMCPAWRTWADVLSREEVANQDGALEFVSYTCIAVFLALVSCLLTLYLTDSTTFSTRKELNTSLPAYLGKNQNPPPESKRKVMYYAAGSGIPEIKTIMSGFVIHGYLGVRTLFTKAVGLSLSVASGLSLGKEGPLVHIATCIGNIVSRIAPKYKNNEAKCREILSAACAAGVAVAFGAPIGGTLFSLEEVSYFFPPKVMWRSFFCAMIAAITLKLLDPFGTGKLVLFQVTYERDWHAYELLPFIVLGILGGVYGAYFSKLNHYWSKHIRNKTFLGAHPILEVLLITLLSSILGFLNPFTRMGGTELIYSLFRDCRTHVNSDLCITPGSSSSEVLAVIQSILLAMMVKAILTVITFGIRLPAGIFIPTLGVGACAGRIIGIGIKWFRMRYPDNAIFRPCKENADCIIPGLYAMVGAAATLSGVTRTTVSLAVIMFELTDTLTYAVPVMLSVLVAKTVADALEPKGIYELVIELNQLPYLDAKHGYLWGHTQINDVTARDVQVIRVDRINTVKSLRGLLLQHSASSVDDGFPILRRDLNDEGMRMVGYIGVNELQHALNFIGLVDDNVDREVHFHTTYSHELSSSISSLQDAGQTFTASDPYDFSPYMDKAPITMANNSPMEFLHQVFVKLGARYAIITNADGLYEGIIDKKTWLAFLGQLEEK